ncbi:MAG: chromate efflux transporter [Cyanobacteria bacterium J06642_2]
MPQSLQDSTPSLARRLQELVALYTRLGTVGFGGPQAHIAMQNDEAVARRQWMSQEQFVEGMAMCEMLPGPASTQMGIYVGYVRAGQLGALAAGLSFIAPAFVIVVVLSWAYFRFQQTPQLEGVFLGVAPVTIAIVLAFCWKLARKTLFLAERSRHHNSICVAIAVAVFALTLGGYLPILPQLIAAGLVGMLLLGPNSPWPARMSSWFVPFVISPVDMAASAEVLTASSLWGWERIGTYGWPLMAFFLKTGTAIFGGGLVIIPFIETEVVEQLGWLTPTEFLNGVAIGQLSPGPVVLTSAFIGYKVAGLVGALSAAFAMFLPSFAFIMLASPWLLKIRHYARVKAFFQGVTPGVLGAISAALVLLATRAIAPLSLQLAAGVTAIAVLASIAVLYFKMPTWLLIPGGAIAGLGLNVLT